MDDLAAFEAFRRAPGPDSLVALLRAHQDGVYTIALNVLHHPQDAEDASQEALLKIAGGAAELREARGFKCWLYRLVYRTAVDHLRRRQARVRTQEGSKAMSEPSLSEEARATIHEAMIRLPDEDRLLLVEHYFEKASLEELGRREGISGVAVRKRIDRALVRLKRVLAGGGFALVSARVSEALESATPASAPAGLIAESIVAKAALVAAGGMAVGTKSYAFGSVLAAAMVFLILGAGGGYLVGWKRSSLNRPDSSPLRTAARDRESNPQGGGASPATASSRSPALPSEPGKSAPAESSNLVAERLARFRKWHREWMNEEYDKKSLIAWHEHLGKLNEQGPELREIMLKDVDALLAFLRDPENELCLSNLLSAAFQHWRKQTNGFWFIGEQLKFEDFPPALTEGLLALLAQGSETQKLAVIGLTGGIRGQPEAFLAEYRKLLNSSSIPIVLSSTDALGWGGKMAPEDLEVVKRNAESSPAVGLRQESYKAIARTGTPEALDWLFSQLVVQPDARTTSLVAEAIKQGIGFIKIIPKEVEPRATEAVISALGRELKEDDYDSLLFLGVNLSAESTGRILEFAAPRAPTEALRRATLRVQESFRNGERNTVRLIQQYYEAKKSP